MGFLRWLFGLAPVDAHLEPIGEVRQRQQILDSSIRRLRRAEAATSRSQENLMCATQELKGAVEKTVEQLRAGERAILAAAEAVELSRRKGAPE